MKEVIKSLLYIALKFFYPKIDLTSYNPVEFLKVAFFQKVLGINRNIPWPIHRTSTVKSVDKIDRGTRLPGISKNCYFDARNGIVIGENVWIGPDVTIISMNHNVNDYTKYLTEKPIKIGKNSWIASNVLILPEVELGEHTVVAAGAVVTKSFLEGDQIIGGNPAKVIKKIDRYKG